jgi:DHA2 family multidrug resistance protein-like MFS transporter
VNIPFGIAALIIGRMALPHVPRQTHTFDWQSAVLSALVFGLGISAVDSVGHGEAAYYYLTEFIVAALAGTLLVRRQLGMTAPLLPLDLLRIPIFALSIFTSIASFCAQMLAYTALPFYLEDSFGYSAVQIGLLITPWPIAIAFAAPLAGRLVERYPAGLLGGIGLLLFAGGLLSLALLPPHPATVDLVWRMALSGAGFGLFQSPNNRTLIAAAPRERSGGASGMLGTARLLGQTVGAALVALLLARFAADGARLSLFAGAGFALVGGMFSMLRLAPAGARGLVALQVRDGQRLKGE